MLGKPKKERPTVVDLGTQAIAAALNDWDSLNFYRHLLWGLLRHVNTDGSDHSRVVYLETQARHGLMSRSVAEV